MNAVSRFLPVAILGVAQLLLSPDVFSRDDITFVSLRLGGKEVPLVGELRGRVAEMAREIVNRCGPNSTLHPGNFGQNANDVDQRFARLLRSSRLHVIFAKPLETQSNLGGSVIFSEAAIGLENNEVFVGPNFTRDGNAVVEHLQCNYLASLELACMPELSIYLPAMYHEGCGRLTRGPDGRILMPAPDIAPSCS